MILEFLIGAAVGALVGAAIIGICECIEYAKRIFEADSDATVVKFIKKDSRCYESIKWHPKVRAALQGEGGRLIAMRYRDGMVASVTSMDKELSSDFDDCSGYLVNRRNREEAIRIR